MILLPQPLSAWECRHACTISPDLGLTFYTMTPFYLLVIISLTGVFVEPESHSVAQASLVIRSPGSLMLLSSKCYVTGVQHHSCLAHLP